ncbi:hemolysin family protein [Paucidesulfovibrio longus]|uniref:hemolysin family protein n=1 Tax=Paucidesulfovibrio longus TaxID=889 RepID=UPI0003B530F1|nr:hemolysin family protein [Paucidesulfovibrio longus]
MIELILAVGLATFVSAFCSVAEAVLYSFPWSLVESLKKQGHSSGEVLETLRNNVEEPITAILTLNTVAHTVGASLAGAAWAAVYGEQTLGLFAVGFTIIILLFSEILPKTVGVIYARPLAPRLARLLLWMVFLFKPVAHLATLMGKAMRRNRTAPDASEEDILALVSMTRRAGVIKPYEARSINNILLLDDKTVEQIMTPRTVVFSLPANMTVAEARESRSNWPHSRFPVYEGDNPEDVVGVVYRRQVFEALADDEDDKRLSDLMRSVRFVPESMTLDKVLMRFLESRMHLFVVLDEYGGIAGVVALEDVLEEILGSEIVDETDQVVDMREMARRRRDAVVSGRVSDKGS